MSKKKDKPGVPAFDTFVMKRFDRTIREGVTTSINWRNLGKRKPAGTTAIHWRPRLDPSASLAQVIINRVCRDGQSMPLELDGHIYLVTKVRAHLVPNKKGGVKLVYDKLSDTSSSKKKKGKTDASQS